MLNARVGADYVYNYSVFMHMLKQLKCGEGNRIVMWWKPFKSMKLNKSQKVCFNASVRLSFNQSHLFIPSANLPSSPPFLAFGFKDSVDPENMRKEPSSINIIPVETSYILYFPGKPTSPFLWADWQFRRPLLYCSFLCPEKLCLRITYYIFGGVFDKVITRTVKIFSAFCKQLVN